MPLQTCETDGCTDPAERGAGSCIICARPYCIERKKKSYHLCPSEVATFKFLEQTAVPVPKVSYHQLESENDTAGASIIVMEKLPGRALEWNETNSEQREKTMEQLATIYWELEKFPFEKTGSIVSTNSGFDIAQLPFL